VTNLDDHTAIKAICSLVLLVIFVGAFISFGNSQESIVGNAVKSLTIENSQAEPIEQDFIFSCINGEEFIEEQGILTATYHYCVSNSDGTVERIGAIYPSK
jgi:hypothetical protein